MMGSYDSTREKCERGLREIKQAKVWNNNILS
jgi:hypothetical protein